MTANHAPARDRADDSYYILVQVPQSQAKGPRRRRWPKLVAVALGIALAGGSVQWSLAQRRDAPRIIVAPMIRAEPASQASLTIQVGPPEALPDNSFLRLRGFPTSVSLTEGHAIAPGAWAIPLFGLSNLKAVVPAGVSGRAEITISLVSADGNTLAETSTEFAISARTPPRKLAPPRQPLPSGGLPPATTPLRKAAPPPPGPSGEARAQAERMLSLGDKHLEQGNIGAARSFLQRAADAGLADAALKLGATYDPAELAGIDALAVTPDLKEARTWYERARDLGAPEAERRLGRLGR